MKDWLELYAIRRECLDFMIPLGEKHLRRILAERVTHYNRGRPHLSLGPGIPLLAARGSTVKSDSSYSFRFNEMARPGGLELPTFWFVAIRVKMLNALFGVAYGLETPFFPQLAAPNPAPKTESYRTGSEPVM